MVSQFGEATIPIQETNWADRATSTTTSPVSRFQVVSRNGFPLLADAAVFLANPGGFGRYWESPSAVTRCPSAVNPIGLVPPGMMLDVQRGCGDRSQRYKPQAIATLHTATRPVPRPSRRQNCHGTFNQLVIHEAPVVTLEFMPMVTGPNRNSRCRPIPNARIFTNSDTPDHVNISCSTCPCTSVRRRSIPLW